MEEWHGPPCCFLVDMSYCKTKKMRQPPDNTWEPVCLFLEEFDRSTGMWLNVRQLGVPGPPFESCLRIDLAWPDQQAQELMRNLELDTRLAGRRSLCVPHFPKWA